MNDKKNQKKSSDQFDGIYGTYAIESRVANPIIPIIHTASDDDLTIIHTASNDDLGRIHQL